MKNSARTNPNIKDYLTYLRAKVGTLIEPKRRKRIASLNTALMERLYFELTNNRERIIITGDARFPIIKIVGTPDDIGAISDDIVDDFVVMLAEDIDGSDEDWLLSQDEDDS